MRQLIRPELERRRRPNKLWADDHRVERGDTRKRIGVSVVSERGVYGCQKVEVKENKS